MTDGVFLKRILLNRSLLIIVDQWVCLLFTRTALFLLKVVKMTFILFIYHNLYSNFRYSKKVYVRVYIRRMLFIGITASYWLFFYMDSSFLFFILSMFMRVYTWYNSYHVTKSSFHNKWWNSSRRKWTKHVGQRNVVHVV